MENQSKIVVSKDVLDADKVINNIDNNPQIALTELARNLSLNLQKSQLNEMNIDRAMDFCIQSKAIANIIIVKWAMRGNKSALPRIPHGGI